MSASAATYPARIPPAETLKPCVVPGSATALRWYALWTRGRHEKKVTRLLQERRIETFLPLVPEIHWWSDRRKIVEMPLFPGYTFVHCIPSACRQSEIAFLPGVVSVVGWNGTPVPLLDAEIETIRALLARRIQLRPYQFLPMGTRVRIRGGSLNGLEGIYVGGSERKLIVSVALIQRSVAMRLDGYDVVPV